MQRAVDILLASVGLILVSPILLTLAFVVKISDGGPVFYHARRVGQHGHLFNVVKFRTMVPDAAQLGGGITRAGDARITTVGKFLRRYKLDELPQLINVLKGEMSFVGARPEDPQYVALYTENQKKVLAFRPGITSPASLRFRNEESLLTGPDWHERYIHDILPRKLAMDISYLADRTIWGDARLIMRTLRGILNEKTTL